MTPTDEQKQCIDFALSSKENLQIIARAGAAKTTTLIMIAEALPKVEILCLAFNKKIAMEMNERLPDNCTAKTLNGLGHRIWGKFLKKKLELKKDKCFTLMKQIGDSLTKKSEIDDFREFFAETLSAINHGKNCGWIPEKYQGYWKPLMSDDDFWQTLDFIPSELQKAVISDVTEKSFRLALRGQIDFNDQILCPAICPVTFDPVPLVLIDEAQDLSHLNHVTLSKIVKRNRIIAVGDPCQAIYAFRGASAESMPELAERFQMETLFLTTCFRCASSIVENARWRAPDMNWPGSAIVGSVQHYDKWDYEIINDETAVLCRNNAPLFRLAIRLLTNGKFPQLAGRDVAYQLIKIMKKLGKPSIIRQEANNELFAWREKQLEKTRFPSGIHDKVECIQIFLEQTRTLGDAIAYLEQLAKQSGRIHLMTGHKAKGLEFTEVFILDVFLCNASRDAQNDNIRYVMETRAKETLNYIETEGYVK